MEKEMENEVAYISMRKSLDSFRDVALKDYALINNDDEKEKYSDFVTKMVKEFLKENALDRQEEWHRMEGSRGKAGANPAPDLLANEHSLCPPGFQEVDGICVPI